MLDTIKRIALILIRKAGLNAVAFQAWERVTAARAPKHYVAFDGLPLPPPLLQIRVVGHANPDRFLLYGLLGKIILGEALARHGGARTGVMLDFGCGCGRTVRFFNGWLGELHGCDYNSDLVSWCTDNLPFMTVQVNELTPPLPYGESQFDVVYSLSVWTHWRASLQRDWMAEMHRVIKPGGLLLITTQGDHTREELLRLDRRALLDTYDSGELVVSDGNLEGSNFCVAYAPPSWVRRELLDGWEELEHVPAGSVMTGHQDLWVLRRRQE